MSHVHLSELAIARLVLGGGEPPPGDADCPSCRQAIEQARGDAAGFARAVGPRTLPSIEARLARRRAIWFGAVASAAVAAAALLWFAGRSMAVPERPVIAAKGDPTLHLVARHHGGAGARSFEVLEGMELAPGDAIRFVIDPGAGRYLLVVSLDGAGQLTVYHPYGGDASAPIEATGLRVVLDGSVVLDDAPGPERIWAVISDRPIAVAELRVALAAIRAGGAAAIRRGADLMIPGARQASTWFEKPSSLERTP